MEQSPRGTVAAGSEPAATGGAHPLALELTGVSKSFGGTRALDDVSLRVRQGKVHALLGGNGSGKSTAIKILAGVYAADAGSVTIFDDEHALANYSSSTAQSAGLRFVHQDLGLFEELSIAENFALDAGYPRLPGGGIHWTALYARVAALLTEYELHVDPRMPIGDLRPSDRTMVAIARALQDQEGQGLILVLDEPTASLALHESELLLEKVRRRALKGQTVVIVSHRLQEVLSVADDFTIFRDGRVVGVLTDASPTEDELVEIMAGGLVEALRPTGSLSHSTTEPLLIVEGLITGPLHGVDLTVHRGEIVGVAGLVGSGRSSLLKSIFGAMPIRAGSVTLHDRPYSPSHIDEAMSAGVAMVPEDRGRDAAFADLSMSENLAMSVLRETWKRWMPRGREHERARQLIERFRIKVAGPEALFNSMSGGNQQKSVIARWLQREPSLLLLDEPTQGVDVMSRSDIYADIRQAAKSGCGVLVASSDMSELHALCDRVVFLRAGRIGAEADTQNNDVDDLIRMVLKDPTVSVTLPYDETRSTP